MLAFVTYAAGRTVDTSVTHLRESFVARRYITGLTVGCIVTAGFVIVTGLFTRTIFNITRHIVAIAIRRCGTGCCFGCTTQRTGVACRINRRAVIPDAHGHTVGCQYQVVVIVSGITTCHRRQVATGRIYSIVIFATGIVAQIFASSVFCLGVWQTVLVTQQYAVGCCAVGLTVRRAGVTFNVARITVVVLFNRDAVSIVRIFQPISATATVDYLGVTVALVHSGRTVPAGIEAALCSRTIYRFVRQSCLKALLNHCCGCRIRIATVRALGTGGDIFTAVVSVANGRTVRIFIFCIFQPISRVTGRYHLIRAVGAVRCRIRVIVTGLCSAAVRCSVCQLGLIAFGYRIRATGR